MLAHVDANNFYASCEQLFNPALRGKPVVVLSNNDGAVVARSAEAKALGIDIDLPENYVPASIRVGWLTADSIAGHAEAQARGAAPSCSAGVPSDAANRAG